MRKSIRYGAMAVCTAIFLVFTLNYTYFSMYEKSVLIALSLLGGWLFVATLTLKQTNGIVYIAAYLIALFLLLFARTPYEYDMEIGAFVPIDTYFKMHAYMPGFAWFNLIGNAVVFVPMGIVVGKLSVATKYKLLALLAIIALVLPAVEYAQYIAKVGFFDYYDWIFNGISAVVGYIYAACIYRKERSGR